jgi:hypothetical protein
MLPLANVTVIAALLAWLPGIAGVRRRDSPFND